MAKNKLNIICLKSRNQLKNAKGKRTNSIMKKNYKIIKNKIMNRNGKNSMDQTLENTRVEPKINRIISF